MSDSLQKFFDDLAPRRDYWISKNRYYYDRLHRLHQWLIPKHGTVLDVGCGTGGLLSTLSPKKGVGIDFSFEMVKIAKKKYPNLEFRVMDAHLLEFHESFDYIVLSNLVGYSEDIWQVLRELRKVSHAKTRIVITNYNYLWQPVFSIAERVGFKMPDRIQNWLPQRFIEHFLALSGFEVVKKGKYLFGLIEYCVARPTFLFEKPPTDCSVSIIVPTYQEAGNIETIIQTMPLLGNKTELIFVDLPGKDGTSEKIKEQIRTYSGPLKIKYIRQTEKSGKIGAIRLGVENANGDIILIYDADVTVPPDDLQKFYQALVEGKGEFINGTRLIYPTERGAMRFLNHMGNWLFAVLLSWGLGQHFTDTLCGTKGFWKRDFKYFELEKASYDTIDRYGDFYLILSAYRRNLKIAEVPVRYKTRRYGDSKMHRIRNGFRFFLHFLLFFWRYKILRTI